MILRRFSEHVKDQNWTAIALDFFVVIAGILIAFQITNWNENQTARAKLDRVEEVLQGDLLLTYMSAKERIAVVSCRLEVYQAISERLIQPDEAWDGMPRARSDTELPTALPNLLRSPHRPWGSRIWQAELEQGTFNLMEDSRRDSLDSIMRQADLAQEMQKELYRLQGRLKVLAISTDIPKNDRLRYYDMLGELDDGGALLEVLSRQIITRIEAVGISLSAEDRRSFLDVLASQNERAGRIYGDCYNPISSPIFNEWQTEGAAP